MKPCAIFPRSGDTSGLAEFTPQIVLAGLGDLYVQPVAGLYIPFELAINKDLTVYLRGVGHAAGDDAFVVYFIDQDSLVGTHALL